MIQYAYDCFPIYVQKAEILEEWVGLRPQRTLIRVEIDKEQTGKDGKAVVSFF